MVGLDEYSREAVDKETIETVQSVGSQYKYGFVSDIETEFAPKGISEDIVRLISKKNNEPDDSGIVIVDDDLTIDRETELEERRAYLEEARSQEASSD